MPNYFSFVFYLNITRIQGIYSNKVILQRARKPFEKLGNCGLCSVDQHNSKKILDDKHNHNCDFNQKDYLRPNKNLGKLF